MHRAFYCLFFFFLFFSYASSQTTNYREFTRVLCADSMHGRGYVNNGDKLASAYLAKKFETNKLKPVFENYFQYFPLSVNTFPDSCNVEIDGQFLAQGVDFIVSPESGSANGSYSVKEVSKKEILGIHSIHQFSKLAKGTILLIRKSEYSTEEYKQIQELFPDILKIVPIIELVDEKFTWSVSRRESSKAHILIQESSCDFKKNQNIRLYIHNKFFANYVSQNVVGLLPSTRKSAKTVMITAHYDHLGRMGNNCLFPGANDNASGNAMLLSIMENLVKKKKRKHNYVFVCFGGEEAGLIGSAYLSRHLPIPKNQISFLLNLDIFGSGEEGITVVNATLFEKEFKQLERLNKRKKAVGKIKKRGPAANSDHYFFTQMGIPSFFIYTEGPNKNYHDVFDTFENLSFAKFNELSSLLTKFVEKL